MRALCGARLIPAGDRSPAATTRSWSSIPDPRGVIIAGGDDAGPVGAERRAVYRAAMLERGQQGLARGCVPDPRGVVIAGGDDAGPVGAEHRAVHLTAMPERA